MYSKQMDRIIWFRMVKNSINVCRKGPTSCTMTPPPTSTAYGGYPPATLMCGVITPPPLSLSQKLASMNNLDARMLW